MGKPSQNYGVPPKYGAHNFTCSLDLEQYITPQTDRQTKHCTISATLSMVG